MTTISLTTVVLNYKMQNRKINNASTFIRGYRFNATFSTFCVSTQIAHLSFLSYLENYYTCVYIKRLTIWLRENKITYSQPAF